jgi:hypothetical protein
VGRVEKIVAVLQMLFPPIGLDNVPDRSSFGMPENQSSSQILMGTEKIQFSAELPVVSLFGFLQESEIIL